MYLQHFKGLILFACALLIISCGEQKASPDLPSRTETTTQPENGKSSGKADRFSESDSSNREEIEPIINQIQISKRNRKCANSPCARGFWLDVNSRTIHSYGPKDNYGIIGFEAKNENKLFELFTGPFARTLKGKMLDCSRGYYPEQEMYYELIVTVSENTKFRRNVTRCIESAKDDEEASSQYARTLHEIQSIFWEEFFGGGE